MDYRVAVSIILNNGMSPVLAIIAKDLLGIRGHVGQLTKDFEAWKPKLLGVGAILGGAAILGSMTKLAEKAADFQDAMTKVAQLNPKVAQMVQNGDLNNMSFGIGRNLGMNVEDVTKVFGGIYGVLQDTDEAKELTPIAARYARLMELRHPGSHPEDSINTLMRAGELSGRLTNENGAIDPKKVEEWFDTAARLEAATHGQVNAQSLLGLAQQGGGVALRGLSQEGYEHMAIIAQMMGGQRAGTALLSLRSQMGGGAMLKRSAEAMQQYGLLKDGEWSSEGGHVALSEGASRRLGGMVSQDPMQFVNELVTRLEEKGVTNRDDQMTALQRILGRQTTQRMVADMLLARQQIQRETAGLEQGVTVQQGLQGYGGNIRANMQNLASAWHNLIVAVAGPESEHFVSVLKALTSVVNSAAGFASANPGAIKMVAEGIAAIGVALVGAGAVSLVALAGVPAIVTGIVAAAGTLIAVNWNAISSGFSTVGSTLYSIGQYKWEQITSVFNGISSAISSFISQISALYDRVKSFIFPGVGSGKPAVPPSMEDAYRYSPMRFNPGVAQPQPQPISLSLNVDGHELAQTVSDHVAQLLGFPTGAPAPNGAGIFYHPDLNASNI